MRRVTVRGYSSGGRVQVGSETDLRERALVTVPGYESIPQKGEKTVEIDADRCDASVVIGVSHPSTDLEPGERRISAKDSSGEVVSTITLKANGDILIESKSPTGKVMINGTDWETHSHSSKGLISGGSGKPVTGTTGGVV